MFCSAPWRGCAANNGSANRLGSPRRRRPIHFTQCGRALCGKVVWLRDAVDPDTGRPQTDSKNPNPTLRSRPMVGVQLFIGMNPVGPGRWAGRIYNADDGGIYESKIALLGPKQLRVEGCLGAFCGGETWTKLGGR